MISDDEESRKLYCGNLDQKVDEELLYELFLQAGPLEKVIVPKERNGASRGFAFIIFKHECSVPYAVELFRDTALYGRMLELRARRGSEREARSHQRSHTVPSNFGRPRGPEPHMDFDSLLAMSQNMRSGGSSMPPPPPGVSMGAPMMPHIPPPPAVGQSSNFMPYASQRDSYGQQGPWNEPEGWGQQGRGGNSCGSNGGNFNRESLSMNSLRGNWSARNDDRMQPSESHRRSNYQSRRSRDNYDDDGRSYEGNQQRHRHYDGESGPNYDRDQFRGRNRDFSGNDYDRNRRSNNRSRSGDIRHRRGRY